MTRTIGNVVAAIDHIEHHLDEPLGVEAIADEMGYSHCHLHRAFTRAVRLTMHSYIRRRRLTEAAKSLAFSDRPIVEIALQAGYESQQAFSSAFKSMYKLSPHRFRENRVFYPLQMRFEFDEATLEAGFRKRPPKHIITFAREENIPEWMRLVRLVVDGFPCLNEKEHVDTLKWYIGQGGALIVRAGDVAVGIMMISHTAGSVDFLGVHPLYHSRGIAHSLLVRAMSELSTHEAISTTTYREGDKADTGHRNALKRFGFVEAELLVEFGYPTQRMTITASTLRDTGHGG